LGQSLLPRLGEDNRALFNLVCGFAICAATAAKSSQNSPSEDEKANIQRYQDAAIDALQRAVKLGYSDLSGLETDPDLVPLRNDPRLAEIVSAVKNAKHP
jgi:hypothetical protein